MRSHGEYWSREVEVFDAIYSHRKNKLHVLLDRIFRKCMYDRFKLTINQSEPIKKRKFLDVGLGCSTGLFSLELARGGAKRVTGIDVAPRMIEICKSRAKKEGLSHNTSFILRDIIGFETDEEYDVTLGMGLLDYIRSPLPELTRMRELTTSKVMLSFPILWNWRTIPRKIRLRLKGCPVYFYTKRRIRILLGQAGFDRVIFKPMGPMYFVIAF